MPGKEVDILAPRNDHLESGNWIANVIWDATRISPELLESDEEDDVQSKATEKSAKKGGAVVVVKDTKLDPFNISNDPLYEHSRESKYRIRQTFGAIEVFHSMPAKILQLPYVGVIFYFHCHSLTHTAVQDHSQQIRSSSLASSCSSVPYGRVSYILQTQIESFSGVKCEEKADDGGSFGEIQNDKGSNTDGARSICVVGIFSEFHVFVGKKCILNGYVGGVPTYHEQLWYGHYHR